MDAITYSAARASLARTMNRVCNDHEALVIARNGEQSVVILSLGHFRRWKKRTTCCTAPPTPNACCPPPLNSSLARARHKN